MQHTHGSFASSCDVLGLLQLIGSVLDVKFVGILSADPKEGHHATIKQVCNLTLHLHVEVLDQHAIDNGNCLKVDGKLFKLLPVGLYVVHLLLESDIVVTLVARSLPLEAPNALLYV